MTSKAAAAKKAAAEAADAPPMRVHIRLTTEHKNVVVDISDVQACAKAKGVDGKDAVLLSELHELLMDIHDAQPDAGKIELTPENVANVLRPAEEDKDETADDDEDDDE